MEWLNYHHLNYFWTIAREGSVTKAAQVLNLTQPTLSAQIRTLEEALGGPLFVRAGRGLKMTDLGRTVFVYAEEIFGLGRELLSTVRGEPVAGSRRFAVGISDHLSKLAVFHLLKPLLELPEPVRLVCLEEGLEHHIALLLRHELDLVLSDAPLGAHSGPRVYNHLLGEAGVQVFGTPALIQAWPGAFPRCLRGAPFVVPPVNSALRRALDHWFDQEGLRPRVIAEVQDVALIKTFAAGGCGFVIAPAVLTAAMARQYDLHPVGRIEGLRERVYAISAERRIKHPAVRALQEAAVREVFA